MVYIINTELLPNIFIFIIISTTFLYFIPNRSSYSKRSIIPIIVAGLTKYIYGNWYESNTFSNRVEFSYWVFIYFISFLIILILNFINHKKIFP